MEHSNKITAKQILALQGILFFLSFSGVCTKTAAKYPAFSLAWIFFYGLSIGILGFYAIAWQQILKRIPLTVAFCNKAVSIIWAMIWGALFFQEQLTLKMILGAALVLAGVIMVVKTDE